MNGARAPGDIPARWLAVPLAVALLAGLAAGLLLDTPGAERRLNLLAPPLLGLLAWNLVVYLLMLAGAGRRGGDRPGPLLHPLLQPWLRRLQRRTGATVGRWHVAAVLHAAAATFALGALASMYLHGLAFEVRAGWESTFLGPAAVHRVLTLVLGPAAWIAGVSLPDTAALAALRVGAGDGENAGRWMHLYALTVSLFVLVPRTLFAAWAAWRASAEGRDAAAVPAAAGATAPRPVLVLPYSHRVAIGAQARLAAALEGALGAPVALHLGEPVPLGGEDALALPHDAPAQRAALFALSATPEAENHGAFVQALSTPGTPALVLVDESGFAARYGEARRAERRRAWQRLPGTAAPLFVELAP